MSRESVRAGALRQALESASTEASLDDVRAAARRLPAADLRLDSPACGGCVEAVACEGDTCGIWMRSLYEPVLLLAKREGPRTTLRIRGGSDLLGGSALLAMWRRLDPAVAERAEEATAVAGEWFSPRWGPLAGASVTGATDSRLAYGLRLGAHRWHTPSVVSSYALDVRYAHRFWPGSHRDEVTFALPVRIGLARWDRWSDLRHGRPGAMAYVHAAPLLSLRGETAFGWRAGVGVASGSFEGALLGSLFVEVHAEQTTADAEPGYGVSLGWGF